MGSGGTAGSDGKIRICDLHPGAYRVLAFQNPTGASKDGPIFFGETEVTIGDRDLHGIRLYAKPSIRVAGEVSWDGKAPDPPVTEKLSVNLMPFNRPMFGPEIPNLNVDSTIPGTFTLPGLLADDYEFRPLKAPAGFYVKKVTFGGLDALYQPLHAGATTGSSLHIVLARDGATIAAKVADQDGHAVPDSTVVLIPADASGDAAVAAMLIQGQTDQYGVYKSNLLAPGKYFALATNDPVDFTPETISKLAQARVRAHEVDVAADSTTELSLTPVDLQ
jgi:hypothetical protein